MFYDIFKDLCEKKGVSVSRACIEMELSRSIAAKWKNTKTKPSAEVLPKIAKYFGVSIDYLLSAETEETPTLDRKREISMRDVQIAFFHDAGKLSDEEMKAYWDDARDYINYKIEQKRRKKGEPTD